MRSFYRRIITLVIVVALLVGGYTLYRFVMTLQGKVPQDFSDARAQGGLISEKIVANSNDVASKIAHLSDSTATVAQASSTMGDITSKVTEIRNQAIDLSTQLGKMSQSLPGIRSQEARDAVLQSISQRLALVSDLITYTDEVTRLVVALRLHIQDGVPNTKDIAQLVDQVNSQVTAINNFNRAANESMDKFDSLLH